MEDIKSFYEGYSDKITEKRAESPYLLRRYAHAQQYNSVLKNVQKGMRVLDAGCGEGVLSFMMAEKGAEVVGVDLSVPNIKNASARAVSHKGLNVSFAVADVEHLPFADNSFDLVVSSHVLEHIPDFDQGMKEIMRVTKSRAVIAIPTACNLCSFVQVGHGWFYLKGLRSFCSFFIGALYVFVAYISGKEGVDEGYVGTDMPHVFRFTRILKNKARKHGYILIGYEASSICIPYFESVLPLIRFLDRYKDKFPLRNFGYGTTYILKK